MSVRPARLMLLPDDIADCESIALRRHESGIRNNRPPKNGAPTDPRFMLEMHQHSVPCECAGWLYLRPCKWQRYAEEIHGLADLEDWIDVKGIKKLNNKLIVQCDDPDDWAYLLIGSWDHPWYDILGWCWGREAKTVPITDPRGELGGPSGPAHFVAQDAPFMKSPVLLYDELRRRQANESTGLLTLLA